jgi:chorismate mutase / prephenate dehydratase
MTVATEATLDELRRQIDSIDDAMHDLLMKRADLAAQVRVAKGPGGVIYQPGREAQILRRLARRHRGSLPVATLVGIWRAIIGASNRLQASQTIAVPIRPDWLTQEALRHFGASAPLAPVKDMHAAIDLVRRGKAQLALCEISAREKKPWWLECGRAGQPMVVAAVPFAANGASQAMVLARSSFSPSGEDRGLVAVNSRGTAAAVMKAAGAVGLKPLAVRASAMVKRRRVVLLETEHYVTQDAERLGDLHARLKLAPGDVWVVGGFAVPLADGPAPAR